LSYPTDLDDVLNVLFGQQATSALQNQLINAVNAIEATVGVMPQGDYDSVAGRLDDLIVNDGYTKGDTLVSTGGAMTALGVGANGQVLTADSTQATGVKWAAAGSGTVPIDNSLCNGRLTLVSGTPVTVSDVTAASTLYFTPYLGSRISLYDGTTDWEVYDFSEASLALSSLGTGSNYDVFAYWDSGSLALELSAAWSSDTARSDAVVFQDGVYVLDSDKTRRYLGTIRTTGASTTEQSNAKKYVWNYYNRVDDVSGQGDSSGSWTQGTPDVWHPMNGGSANYKHEFVVGFSEDVIEAYVLAQVQGSGTRLGIGLDRTDVGVGVPGASGAGSVTTTTSAVYRGWPGIGYHYFNVLQGSYNGTALYYALGDQQFTVRARR